MQVVSASFNVHGVSVSICDHRKSGHSTLKNIIEDFQYFTATPMTSPPQIQIFLEDDFEVLKSLLFYKNKDISVYGLWHRRSCHYTSGTTVLQHQNSKGRVVKIKSKNPDHLYEILYLFILSAVGEALEDLGFVRLHAAGWATRNGGMALVLPQRGGKSTLTLRALETPNLHIFSDETLFIIDGIIFPFPVRMALRHDVYLNSKLKNLRKLKRERFETKFTLPIPQSKVATPQILERILIPQMRRFKLHFAWTVFWGLGLAQMTEFLVTIPKLPRLFKTARNRIKFIVTSFKTLKELDRNYFDKSIEEIISGEPTPKLSQDHSLHAQQEREKYIKTFEQHSP